MALHVRSEAVENATHFHDRPGQADLVAENFCAIRRRKDGFADVETNFAAVDIKGGYHFDVSGAIGPDLAMHQADPVSVGDRTPIKVYSLNQRAGAISNPNDSDPDLSHGRRRKTTQTEALGARIEFRNFTRGESTAREKNQRISKNAQFF